MATEATAPTSTVRLVGYGPRRFHEFEAASLPEIQEELAVSDVTWVDLALDTGAEWLTVLGPELGLHVLGIEDALDPGQRAKLEEFEGQVLFQLNTFEKRDSDIKELEKVAFFLGKRTLLTVQATREDCWDGVRAMLRNPASQFRGRGPDYLAALLVQALAKSLYAEIEEISDEVGRWEDLLLLESNREAVGRVHDLRNSVSAFRRAAWPSREVLRVLAFSKTPYVAERHRKYFRDSHDELDLAIDLAETLRDRVSHLNDLYLNAVAFKQNEVLKVLTVVSVVFMPLTFIVGVYGMNFDTQVSPWSMPELRHPWGYVLTWAFMALLTFAQIAFFWKKGWLKVN